MEKERIVYLDYLRVVSAISVIFLHVAANNWVQSFPDTLSWQVMNVYNSLNRWCVPVFLMISGALFLSRDIDLKTLFSKYILRLAVTYLFWSAFYTAFAYIPLLNYGQPRAISLLSFGKRVLEGTIQLWFLPMLMGVYLAIPLFREVVRSPKVTRYYLAVTFTVSVLLPSVLRIVAAFFDGGLAVAAESVQGLLDSLKLNVFSGFCFYFVLGHWLSQTKLQPKQRRLFVILGAAGTVFTAVLNSAASTKAGNPVDTFLTYFSVFVTLAAVAVFVLFQYGSYPHSGRNRLVTRLSGYTLGVYVLQAVPLLLIDPLGIGVMSFSPVFSIPVLTAAIALVTFLCSAALHRIPVFRRWIV